MPDGSEVHLSIGLFPLGRAADNLVVLQDLRVGSYVGRFVVSAIGG